MIWLLTLQKVRKSITIACSLLGDNVWQTQSDSFFGQSNAAFDLYFAAVAAAVAVLSGQVRANAQSDVVEVHAGAEHAADGRGFAWLVVLP